MNTLVHILKNYKMKLNKVEPPVQSLKKKKFSGIQCIG